MSTTARAKTNFPVKPLVAAVALALAAVNAYADPTPNQLPGAGKVTAVSLGTLVLNGKNYTVAGGGGVGTTIVDGTNAILGARLDLDNAGTIARAVITWGGPNGAPAGLDTINPAGFNIGSNGLLTFSSTAAVTSAAVLNIDASGNPSQIFGRLNAGTGGGGVAPAIFVSNANGIIVGASGQIAAPSGVGLIGADLSSTTTQYEFVGNNNVITTAPPTLGASYIDVTGAQSKVIIDGTINGSLITNTPAQYVLLVGGDVINTGNIFGTEVDVAVGMQAHVKTDAVVNGVAGVSVNRLWYTGNAEPAASLVTGDLWHTGCADCIDIGTLAAGATGSFINTGSISAVDKWIGVSAVNNIRSGTVDDPSLTRLLTGLFADAGVVLNTYNAAGKTELYNVVTGYSTGVTLPFLHVNQALGADGDVTIKALTRASEPSSITTTGDVLISGQNIAINSTINHKLMSDGGVNNDNLVITSAKSVTITADIGAGDKVDITNTSGGGAGINISGNVISDTNEGGYGGIFVTNEGSGSPTVISGNMTSKGQYGPSGVYVDVDGALTMTGNVTAEGDNITITNNADNAVSTIGGAAHAKLIEADQSIVMNFQGPTTISSDVTSDNSYIEITNQRSPSTANATTTITGDLWARGEIDECLSSCGSGGYIFVTAQGPLTISGTMTSDNDFVHVDNYGLSAGNVTDISGAVSAGTDIFIHNFGAPSSQLNISGQLDAERNVDILSQGNLQLGTVNSGDEITIEVDGNSSLLLGAITAADDVDYTAQDATTKAVPDAVITGSNVYLDVLNFQGVNALGNRYTSEAQKPTAQIVTDDLTIYATGSVNAPLVTTNTDWLKNSLWVKPRNAGVFTSAHITANGAGFQAINIGFTENVNVDSGETVTPFMDVGLTSGTEGTGGLQGNGGSSMIIQSKGNLDVWGPTVWEGHDFFQFPGGLVFESGADLTVHVPVYNAWTTNAIPFQGVFLEATGLINSLSYFATNGNSFVNYNKLPTTPPGLVYQIKQPLPTTFTFVNTQPNQAYLNSYKAELAGTPPNTQCPIGQPCP